MANLTRAWRWERFDPDVGDNRSLPEGERLFLEVASGLTGEQLAAFRTALGELQTATDAEAAWLAAFSPVVRLVGEHTVEGHDVKTLADYLRLVSAANGIYNLTELVSVVQEYNSVSGTAALFSQRHSGGVLTTRARSAVKGDARMDAR